MNDQHRFTMKATHDGLTDVIHCVNRCVEPRRFPDRAVYVVNLVVEEILTNIVKYAYDDPRDSHVEVRLVLGQEEIRLEFVDNGREFDPLVVATPPVHDSFADTQPGGVGLLLVRKMADSMTYRREGDLNILTITVRVHH